MPHPRLPELCWVGEDGSHVFKHELYKVPVLCPIYKNKYIYGGGKEREWALNKPGWSRRQLEVARSSQGDIPAARSQQCALLCFCSVLYSASAQCFANSIIFFANPMHKHGHVCANTIPPHSQVTAALKDPFI